LSIEAVIARNRMYYPGSGSNCLPIEPDPVFIALFITRHMVCFND